MHHAPKSSASQAMWLVETDDIVENKQVIEHDHQMFILARR
jgi:hypothetical protein